MIVVSFDVVTGTVVVCVKIETVVSRLVVSNFGVVTDVKVLIGV